ncbi:MAG: hypothetical protein R3C14_07315 [Caldilineaceae bacterium]
MNRMKILLSMLAGLLVLAMTPHVSMAAPTMRPSLDAGSTDSVGIEFKVAYEEGVYALYMRSNVTPDGLNLTLTSQVTIKVPHAGDGSRFTVADLQNLVAGTEWAQTSRVDAPREDANADYISFTVTFTDGDHRVYQWAEGQEIKLFTFANEGACLGSVSLMENGDTFNNARNSANTNPGNQIDVLGIDNDNAYLGNYGSAADCGARTQPDEESMLNKIFMPLIQQ